MIDRTQFAGQGIAGGQPGAMGEFLENDEKPLPPKTVVWFAPEAHVQLNLPGGGGYGDPMRREPERVLADVVQGYVSLDAAEREYGVVIRFLGEVDQLVRLPEHYTIDLAATAARRKNASNY